MSDYIPDSFENFHAWADNFHGEIALRAASLGLSPAQVTAFQATASTLRSAASAVLQKQDDLDAAIGILRQLLAQQLPALRQQIANLKTLPGYNPGIGDALDILSSSPAFDPSTYKPQLKASVFPGHVRLRGTKRGADSLNLYTRLHGQTAWRLLAAKRVRFPFDDDSPLTTPGSPEVREYRAIGVDGDSEIGQPSDIVSATFAG